MTRGRFLAYRLDHGIETLAALTNDHVLEFLQVLATLPDEDGRPVGMSPSSRRHYTTYLRDPTGSA